MKFRFVWVGKTRNKHYEALQGDYLQRLSHFVSTEVIDVRDADGTGDARREQEGKRILEKVNPTSLVCLLDVRGRQFSSHDIAGLLEKWQVAARREICFVIGGAEGVSQSIVERADLMLSLSFLTFTHEMARVVLVEQLYRGFTILNRFPYQK